MRGVGYPGQTEPAPKAAPATKGEESNGSEVVADGTVGDTVRRSDSGTRLVVNSYVVNRIVE